MAQAAVVSALTEKFASILFDKIFQEVLLVTTFGQEFQSLCEELLALKNMLLDTNKFKEDADMGISSSMSNWLRTIEDLVTDAEHIAEECAAAGNCKLRNPIFRYSMGNKIKGLKDRIKNITWSSEHFKYFENLLNVNDRIQKASNTEDNETPSSHVTELNTVGMENNISEITNLVLQEGGPQRIAIVGMGGSGKTLLLQEVFNHRRVRQAPFVHRVWLPVSQKFEYKSLLVEILNQIKPPKPGESSNEHDNLRGKIIDLLQGKKCLFAIDDVWEKFELDRLGLNQPTEEIKILITTRHKKVAESCTHTVNMKPLSSKDSMKLFCIHAFPGHHTPPQDLQDLVEEIVKKCCGVPLALKSIGRYMAKQPRRIRNDWQSALNHLHEDAMEDIMPCLRLSYRALPLHLKPCFLYFSAFPKNTEISTEYLVHAWISEGYVATAGDAYSVGRSYINELIDRCLIEASEISGDGQVKLCKIHDFFHDLAYSVHQPTSFFKPADKFDRFPVKECLRAHRISLIRNNISNMKEVIQSPRVRTLLLSDNVNLTSISEGFFDKVRYLNVLDLSKTSINSLPQSIEKLSHLRLLNLSSTAIKELPDSLSYLRRLLFLDVSNCNNLKRLHSGLGKHKSMQHLNVEGSKKLKGLPVGISKLVGLRTLKGVEFKSKNARKANVLQLCDLKRLTLLEQLSLNVHRSVLQLRDLKRLTLLEQLSLNVDTDLSTAEDPSNPSEGIFGGMTNMRNLSIRNISLDILVSLPEHMKVMKGLEVLRLYKCVAPQWMFDLQNLMELELHAHHQCKRDDYKLLGNIPNLRKLHLSLFTDFFPEEFEEGTFPSLEELILELSDFSKFPLSNNAMPKLKHLRLRECWNVPKTFPKNLKSRTGLTITTASAKRKPNRNGTGKVPYCYEQSTRKVNVGERVNEAESSAAEETGTGCWRRVRLQDCWNVRDCPCWKGLKSSEPVTIPVTESEGKLIEFPISEGSSESNGELTATDGIHTGSTPEVTGTESEILIDVSVNA